MDKKKIAIVASAIAIGAATILVTVKDEKESTIYTKSGVETEWSQATEITTK